MKTICVNKDGSFHWLTEDCLPEEFKKCKHAWLPHSDEEILNYGSTHECVYCGLEIDERCDPFMYYIRDEIR